MFLPHGFEGQGGEHSSARIERFLQLCANNNMILANPSTPAQLFHLLRKQVKQSFRKPLVVFTPKSLLRHPECVSPSSALSEDQFHPILADSISVENVRRLLLCSGKVYYDLVAERTVRNDSTTAIVRIEQLYPFHGEQLRAIVAAYSDSTRYVWVQEEPENMGAWRYIKEELEILVGKISCIARPADSSPAVGSHKIHQQQQKTLVEMAFTEILHV